MHEGVPDRIVLTGVRGFGYHGVLDFERRDGQEFVVDAVIDLPGREQRDDLATTLNYADAAVAIHEQITGEPVDLIETLAERIASALLSLGAAAVEVTVHKPSAPIPVPFGDVAVRIRRGRS